MKTKPTEHEIIQWLQNPSLETGMIIYERLRKGTAPRNLGALIKKICYHYNLPIPTTTNAPANAKANAPAKANANANANAGTSAPILERPRN
jgi:hypothetical protein